MWSRKAVIPSGQIYRARTLADACPVGAITMIMASPSMGADMPSLTAEYESTIQNLFIVGELGGLALIKNAVNQGRRHRHHHPAAINNQAQSSRVSTMS